MFAHTPKAVEDAPATPERSPMLPPVEKVSALKKMITSASINESHKIELIRALEEADKTSPATRYAYSEDVIDSWQTLISTWNPHVQEKMDDPGHLDSRLWSEKNATEEEGALFALYRELCKEVTALEVLGMPVKHDTLAQEQ